LAFAWRGRGKDTATPLTAIARVDHIEDTVLASGSIEPSHLVSVEAQAPGRIVAIHVALGDHVATGALVAEVDPSTVYFTTLGDPDHRYEATLRVVEPAPEPMGANKSKKRRRFSGLCTTPVPDNIFLTAPRALRPG
jgi:hypothetical protein